MPRIPDEEIERLKRDVSLERLCTRYGIELKRKGKNLVGYCPWHKDDKPSFIVTPEKNLWHCMGACDEGGDVISLVMKSEKVSFRHAVEILQELSGSIPPSPTLKTNRGNAHPILVNPTDDLSDAELLGHVVDYYHRTFLNDPKAMKYLQSRNCLHPEAIKHFKIGFANRTIGYRIPTTIASGKLLRDRLQSLGVMRKSGHEHLRGSVVFPIMDLNGQPVQLYGRKITAGLRKGTLDHLYLEQPLCGVWNKDGLSHQKVWILCEAIIDALTLWCHGLRHVTTCFGKNTFPDDLWTLVRTLKPQKVIIAFDNDDAGNKAAANLAPRLAAEGANVHRVQLPDGKDINEYVSLLVGKKPKAVTDALQGMFATAPLMQRADPGTVCLAAPAPVDQKPPAPSSLAAQPLAAKEKPAAKEKILADTVSDDLPPAPMTPSTTIDVPVKRKGGDIELVLGDRSYRVRGLAKNQTFDVMKINLRVLHNSCFHVDTLDLYNARHRTTFINTAADELQLKPEIIKKDLGKVLLKLEELQDEKISQTLKPKEPEITMTKQERQEAFELLKDPTLLERILTDFETYGLVGEETNKLIGYLAAVSRKLDKPLAVIIQSTSASGKSTLMEAILAMIPEEDRIQYSAMTGQSLFYFGDKDLKHKILAIIEEEGAKHASYALKLLQSEGELTIASTGKDTSTGQMVTKEYRVEGPVMILTSSTAIDIDEELLNRCIVLTVDETRTQTQAIHEIQRQSETLEGLKKKLAKKDMLKTHCNAQRLLQPLHVVNPFAKALTFLDDQTRTRRDHQKYLTLIRTIAYVHQYQRPIKVLAHMGQPVKYIEVTIADIATANKLANEVLGRSLDELSPQTRRFLSLINEMVQAACKHKKIERCDYWFTQRDVREYTNWSDYQVKSHLRKLVSLEYVLVHRGGRGQRFVYELLYNGEGADGRKFLMGLIDVERLQQSFEYDANREHCQPDREHTKADQEAPGSTQGATREQPGGMPQNGVSPSIGAAKGEKAAQTAEKAFIGPVSPASSYHTDNSSLAAVGSQ